MRIRVLTRSETPPADISIAHGFDATRSYQTPLAFAFVALLLAAAATFSLPRRRRDIQPGQIPGPRRA